MCLPSLFRVGSLGWQGGPGRLARLVLFRRVLELLLAEVRIACFDLDVCMCFSLLSRVSF